jgi:hypothetical protein
LVIAKVMTMANDCLIFDFETMSTNPYDGVVVSLGMLAYDEKAVYEYEDLVAKAVFIKFDVGEQGQRYGRKVMQSTVDWWATQNAEAKKMIRPMDTDVSIDTLYDSVVAYCANPKKVYTRGNTFDPMFMESLCLATGNPEPYKFYNIRDTRTMIEGLSWGSGVSNKYIPDGLEDKFIAHDPRHDIAMDVMRIQTIIQALEE